jgi:hypothetical protein
MKLSIQIVIAVLAAGIAAQANERDSVLQSLVSKSPLIVSGVVTDKTGAIMLENGIHEMWSVEVANVEVLKGRKPDGATMRVSIDRFGYFQDATTKFVREGQKIILFLQRNRPGSAPRWTGSDPWFSLQAHSTMLAERIEQIAKESP